MSLISSCRFICQPMVRPVFRIRLLFVSSCFSEAASFGVVVSSTWNGSGFHPLGYVHIQIVDNLIALFGVRFLLQLRLWMLCRVLPAFSSPYHFRSTNTKSPLVEVLIHSIRTVSTLSDWATVMETFAVAPIQIYSSGLLMIWI